MENVSGKDGEDGSNGDDLGMMRLASRSDPPVAGGSLSLESMAINSGNNDDGFFGRDYNDLGSHPSAPPLTPSRSNSPLLFTPQVPVAPLPMYNGPSVSNPMWRNDSQGVVDASPEQGIPTIITWNYGGNNVPVEGSWVNWTIHFCWCSYFTYTIISFLLMVSGYMLRIFLFWWMKGVVKFAISLMSNDYVPENPERVAEFEARYPQTLGLSNEDFAKEPLAVTPQFHLSVLDMENLEGASLSSSQPRHDVLNHLLIEKGWASQSLVALGMMHRFQSKCPHWSC